MRIRCSFFSTTVAAGPGWPLALMLVAFPCLAGDMNLRVSGAATSRPAGPLSVQLPREQSREPAYTLISDSGERVAAQSDSLGRLIWWAPPSPAGREQRYRLEAQQASAPSHVKVAQTQPGLIDVTIDERPFTQLRFTAQDPKPYLYPIIGPTGVGVTRDFPMKQTDLEANNQPNRQDERHHRSFWTAHGDLRTTDFSRIGSNHWNDALQKGDAPQRVRKIVRMVSGPVFGQIVAEVDWLTNQGVHELTETRTYTFYRADPDSRLFDLSVVFHFDAGDVMFADTKESGMIAMRLAVTMDEIGAAGQHGAMINAKGQVGEKACWGQRAEWCDYTGPVGGLTVGVAIMDATTNFRHPTPWHVRSYGLFAANPFGLSAYTDKRENGSVTWKKGETVRFDYRVFIHRDDSRAARVADAYELYARPPQVTVTDTPHTDTAP